MSSCVVKKWKLAAAEQRDRPTNSAAAKDMEDRLARMRAEREEQDTMWNTSAPVGACMTQEKNCTTQKKQ